jgi:4-alpha-glucanotransferase
MQPDPTPRRSGILLHPTSLPGPHGSGDLGPGARHFVDWLAAAGQSAWQVLPLTPVGPGNSPYASVSAFAGSPLLVALEPLVERGWLAPIDPAEVAGFDAGRVDYDRVTPWRMARLADAWEGFQSGARDGDRAALAAFCSAEARWLDDYALFMALDADYRARGIGLWTAWDRPHARREPGALAAARRDRAAPIAFWRFVQWCFATQWQALKAEANARGIALIGDLPIFVAHHSADCWARPELFLLDEDGTPTVVAGVPPDFFSATGQHWGNPLYDWTHMHGEGFAWWIERLRHALEQADEVRIDHFRGFEAYWAIPAGCADATGGSWVKAPGEALFSALREALGTLPVIAEDLGIITPPVEQLRDEFGLPGMRILQFAFGETGRHAYLPHAYPRNCVAYTGTHDNDTMAGWWQACSPLERHHASLYLGPMQAEPAHWRLIRAVWTSPARLAICPLQDVLGLGSDHRMNVPGRMGCWDWRFHWGMVGPEPAQRLAELGAACGRAPDARIGLPGPGAAG